MARCRLLERTSDTCNEEWSASVFKFGVLELWQEILSDFLMCKTTDFLLMNALNKILLR